MASYIHAGGKIGALVEVDCETDFVARTEEFQEFAREVAVHVAASNPRYVSKEDVDEQAAEAELRVLREQAASEGKPRTSRRRSSRAASSGSRTIVLLDQTHVNEDRHGGKTIGELRTELAASTGENIVIRRFARFQVGEE